MEPKPILLPQACTKLITNQPKTWKTKSLPAQRTWDVPWNRNCIFSDHFVPAPISEHKNNLKKYIKNIRWQDGPPPCQRAYRLHKYFHAAFSTTTAVSILKTVGAYW
jgi:hypothetical protein